MVDKVAVVFMVCGVLLGVGFSFIGVCLLFSGDFVFTVSGVLMLLVGVAMIVASVDLVHPLKKRGKMNIE